MKLEFSHRGMVYGALFLGFCIARCDADSQLSNNIIGVKELVDHSETYHGREVAVSGYISYVFEGCVIWPEDPEKDSTAFNYEVWYWSEECMMNNDARSGYGTIRGIFDMNDQGHLWSYNSAILNATVYWQKNDKITDK